MYDRKYENTCLKVRILQNLSFLGIKTEFSDKLWLIICLSFPFYNRKYENLFFKAGKVPNKNFLGSEIYSSYIYIKWFIMGLFKIIHDRKYGT